MSVDIDITQFYQTFFEEAEELLVEMEQLLLEVDIESPDAEALNAIFRAAHSIKGGAATFGFTALTETTHIFENLLDRTRRRELALTRVIIDTFLETKDVLQDQLNAYRNGTEPDPETFKRICAVLQQLAQEAGGDAGHAPAPAPAPVAAPAPAAAAAGGNLKVRLIKVSPADQALLREELANLGEITGQEEADGDLTIWLNSQCGTDDIIAVCCFVIDEKQIVVEAVAAGEAPAAVAAAPAPAPAPVAAPAPAAAPAAKDKEKEKAKPAAAAAAHAPDSGSIRVPTEKVDQIINLVGELVITQSMLAQTASSLDPVLFDRLFSGMGQLERNARDLQEAVMSIRMMPMDYVFSRFPRLVRDLASKLGKQIDLVTFGKATELDKSLIERIIDPLTHLVRNSLDHGIETPEKRVDAGKEPTGQLILSAQHAGGNIVIEVSDDGGGLNRDRILAKAMQNNLPGVSESMPDDEVWQLIFAPGFSTAEVVTDVSGRGVGMDVVKRNIQEMGGHVEISSRQGLGTTTRIVLPLTLAILDGMSVRTGEETFILPLNCVMESLQPKADDVHTAANGERVMNVRGEYLPLLELHKVFNVANAVQEPTQGIAVILSAEGKRFALLVDQLIGQHQVVLKNLETNYRKVPCISAATILGDGSVALIVDVAALQRTGVRRQDMAIAL